MKVLDQDTRVIERGDTFGGRLGEVFIRLSPDLLALFRERRLGNVYRLGDEDPRWVSAEDLAENWRAPHVLRVLAQTARTRSRSRSLEKSSWIKN